MGMRPTVELPPGERARPSFSDEPVELAAGAKIDRFVVLERLGAGGMGVVYKAHDPELDRRIAVKLLRLRPSEAENITSARARLLREAQALAKVSHPNVIAIHDVGTVGDDVFLAMELVEGPTLRKWLGDKHSEREVVDVFLAAGRGLDAAHAAGLVHRDFKPENVIVGNDGRVRVLDFGLARAEVAEERQRPKLESSGEKRLDSPLTVEGAIVGTPAYMAPEQHSGDKTDARTDQFSFCVALYEALCGKRPAQGDVDDSALPTWLRQIVLRGLSVVPDERYPDMKALLAELARDPAARRRRLLAGVGVTALAGAAVFGLVHGRGASAEERCRGAEAELAGVWDKAVAARVASAFAATGRVHAAETYDRVAKLLDRFAADWVALSEKSCVDTERGTQSTQLLDLRSTCLRRRADEMRELTALFATEPTGDVIDRAVEAVSDIGNLDACRDNAALTAAVPPPADPATRERVSALDKQLDRVGAFDKAGKFREGLALAGTVAADARKVAYAPVQVRALELLAELEEENGKFDEAEKLYYEVTKKAGEAKNDEAIAIASIHLVSVVGRVETRKSEALALAALAEAAIVRVGNDDIRFAWLEINLGTIAHRVGQFDEALKHWKHALELSEKAKTDKLQIASILADLGIVLSDIGKDDEARADLERSLALYSESLGPDHPSNMIPLTNLANLELKLGKLDLAQEHQSHALALAEASLPPGHPDIASKINNLALIYQARGDYVHAQHEFERVLPMYEKALGPKDATVGIVNANIGEVLTLEKKPGDAVAYYDRAMAIWKDALGPEHPMMAYGLTGAGKCQVELGKPALAIEPLEHALAIRVKPPSEPLLLAETRLVLARALWDSSRDRKRAVELATAAHDEFAKGGDAAKQDLAESTEWLEKHK
jgi:serine/threonine protein kinase/Tfp pilus assembly protein PilF